MAGRKGQKRSQGDASGDPGRKGPPRVDEEWVPSTCTQEDLEKLVWEGVLLDQTTGGCHATAGESFSTPRGENDLVVFVDYFHRGFGIPAHPFLRKLLNYYKIRLIHLHPNSILHLAIFINLCEAFLRIPPHFNLFRHLFCLRAFTRFGSPKVVGACICACATG